MVSHLLPPHHGVTLVTELNQGVESWFDEGEGESSTAEILFRQIWCSSSRFKSFTFQVSLLSHLLVLSSPPDCPAPPLTLSACPRSQPYLSHPVSKLSNFQLQFSTWDLCRVSACLPHRFYQLSRKIRPHKNPNICDTICQNVLPPPRDLPDWSVPMHPVHRQPLASFPDAPGVSHNFMLKMDVYDDEGLRGLWPQDPRVCRAQIRFASIQLLKWSIGFNLVLTLLMDGRMETFPRTPF